MAGQVINEQHFYDIANAIRSKNGESTLYRPQDMGPAILDIQLDDLTLKQIFAQTLVDFNNDEITAVRQFMMSHNGTNSTLLTVNLPNVVSIRYRAFYWCTALTTVNLPEVVTIEEGAFSSCSSLSSITLTKVETIGQSAFSHCTSLTSIDLPSVTSIDVNGFRYCSNLTSFILSGSTVCTLGGAALNDTSIASGTGYIYVPSNLVDTYKAANNWSTYANQISAIN